MREGGPGRWVMMPRQDERFVGARSRGRARVRERRRRVLVVLGEALAFATLIGMFPPLRAMWVVSTVLLALVGVYLGLLLRLRRSGGPRTEAIAVALPGQGLEVIESSGRRRLRPPR